MFKLEQSLLEAVEMAEDAPDDYQVGTSGWVTARFSAESPMPQQLWEKWLDESYELSIASKKKRRQK